ncbi:MAG: Homeodomain-like protein, partial [Linnemannia elongata]
HRRRLTPDETEFLLQQYHSNEKPTTKDRSVFAAYLNLHPRTIQVWFQNRRAKLRR